jgi:polar amino acid transport system substrate-binding protein
MQSMRTLLLLIALMLCSGAVARDFRICVDANDWPPYTHPDRDGDLQSLVRQAAARQGDSITFVALPWLRCESVLLGNGLDGLLGEPWSARSQDKFAFPLIEGRADTSRAAAGIEVVLARRADSPAVWDGHTLTGLQGTVAYVQGDHEIAARLDALGIPNSDDYHSDAQTLKALLAGQTNVAILFPDAARRAAEAPEYKGKITVMTPPFGLIYYYLAFAKPVYAANREAIERLWRTVAEIRVGQVDPVDGGGIVSPRTNGEQW